MKKTTKNATKIIIMLASVSIIMTNRNNQKPNINNDPQTTQTTKSTETTQRTETSKSTETSELTETKQEANTHAYVVNTDDYLATYHPQLGGTYPAGTKAFVYNYMQGKNQVHTAVIPTISTDAGIAIFESQRDATLFTQWLNSVNDKNTMQHNMQTNLDYFYKNVYTNY